MGIPPSARLLRACARAAFRKGSLGICNSRYSMRQGVGIDFGTTNSAVAVARGNGVEIARFGGPENSVDTFRSVRAESRAGEAFARSRLQTAFTDARFRESELGLGPVGAAYHYESTLDHDETILSGDFGGGTSDFSIRRVGPGVRRKGREKRD